jgi:hypothetical protein
MIELGIDGATGIPDAAVYAQHGSGEKCEWPKVEKASGTQRPVVYVAAGRHASYFTPGVHGFGDTAFGDGPSPLLTLEKIYDNFGWVQWRGWWGDDTNQQGLSDSPKGLPRHAEWTPDTFASSASACTIPPSVP